MTVAVDCGAGDHVGAAVSLIVVYGVAGVPLLLAIAFAIWRSVHHARARRRHQEVAHPGNSRPVRAIRGTVALDDGVPFAVRVEINQRGKTWTQKKSTHHSWTETQRRVDARPFRVRTADGALVQVDADADALLCIPFRRAPGDADERAIVAQLENRQEVTVVGRVFERAGGGEASAYRGAAAPRVLVRAPSGERLVISTQPVAEAFRKRMHLHVKWLVIATLTTLVVHLAILSPYHIRLWFGEKATVVVVSSRVSRSSKSTTYYVETRAESGHFLPVQSASTRCYQAVKPGDRIEAVMVPGSPWVMQLGGKVTAHFVSLLLCAAAAVIVVGVYRLQLRTKGPWYLRKRVDMRGDGPANPADLPEA